jgi:hypothetical protein
MPQLVCPTCGMTVSVLDGLAAERPCSSCGTAMTLTEDAPIEEAEVAEPEFAARFVAVEVSDSAPARPTVVLPESEPPTFKPTRSAEAWLTVGHGLSLMRRGTLVALLQPVSIVGLLLLDRLNVMAFVPSTVNDPATATAWIAFVLTIVPVTLAGTLFVLGRLCMYRVPPRTGARGLMLAATVGSVMSVLLGWAASGAWLVPSDGTHFPLLLVTLAVAGGVTLLTEIVFLLGLVHIGRFVKRPAVGRVAVGFVAGLGGSIAALLAVWLVSNRRAGVGLLLLGEACAAVLLLLYLLVLTQARRTVLTKTADE